MSRSDQLRFSAVVVAFALMGVAAAPAQQGAVVIRNDLGVGIVFFNVDDQIVSVHATEDGFFCGPSTVVDPLVEQLVFNPNTIHQLINGTTFVKAYQPGTPADFFADPCAFIIGGPLVAEGRSALVVTDNDLLGSGPGANAFGLMAASHLEDVNTEERINYNIIQRLLFKPNGSFTFLVNRGPNLD